MQELEGGFIEKKGNALAGRHFACFMLALAGYYALTGKCYTPALLAAEHWLSFWQKLTN